MYGIEEVNNMVVYKVYHIQLGQLAQFTDSDDMIAWVNRSSYEFYHIYCGGPGIVIVEVK